MYCYPKIKINTFNFIVYHSNKLKLLLFSYMYIINKI